MTSPAPRPFRDKARAIADEYALRGSEAECSIFIEKALTETFNAGLDKCADYADAQDYIATAGLFRSYKLPVQQ